LNIGVIATENLRGVVAAQDVGARRREKSSKRAEDQSANSLLLSAGNGIGFVKSLA
jgi:hypothetical protein